MLVLWVEETKPIEEFDTDKEGNVGSFVRYPTPGIIFSNGDVNYWMPREMFGELFEQV